MCYQHTPPPIMNNLIHQDKSLEGSQGKSKLISYSMATTAKKHKSTALDLARMLIHEAHNSTQKMVYLQFAESLLLELDSLRNSPVVCQELMNVYKLLNRPVSAYGYLLRARRLGAEISAEDSDKIQKLLKTGDIYAASKDPEGAYVMGSELAYYPEYFEPAVYYLQQSVENGDPHGLAALDLGELLEVQPIHKSYFSSLAHKYFRIASERGNPQYLSALYRPQKRKSNKVSI